MTGNSMGRHAGYSRIYNSESSFFQVLVWCALAGIVTWYLHAELYTVYGPFLKLKDWGNPPYWAQLVQRTRWVMRGIALISATVLIILELRSGVVRSVFQRITQNRVSILLVLVLLGVISGIDFLLPGYIRATDDAESYTMISWLIRDTLSQGQLPIWSNWGDMGFPFMQFYSPLYYTVIAMVSLLAQNVWGAVKIVHLGLHILSVVIVFLYVYNLTKSRYAGLAAAFTVGFAFYRYHTIFYLGRLNMGPTFVIFPLQLYLVDRFIIAKDRRIIGVALAVVSAMGLSTHAFYGGFGGLFAAVYAVVRVLVHRLDINTFYQKTRVLMQLVIWFGIGILASLFYTLPAFIERELSLVNDFIGSSFATPLISVTDVLVFEGSLYGSGWWGGYVGLSVVLLAFSGFISASLGRRWLAIPPFLIFLLTSFLALGHYYFSLGDFFRQIPGGRLVFFFASPGFYLLYAVIVGSVGVGVCVAELEDGLLGTIIRKMSARLSVAQVSFFKKEWFLWCICGLISLDMFRYNLFTNYQVPETRNGSPVNRVAAHQWLADNRHQIRGRVLDLGQSDIVWYIPMISGLPTYATNGSASRYSASFVVGLRRFDPIQLFTEGSSLMQIANTGMVVVDSPSLLDHYPGAVKTGDGAVMIPTDMGLVMIASTRLKEVLLNVPFRATEAASMLSKTPYSTLANEMEIDSLRATAGFIPTLNPPPLVENLPDDVSLRVKVLSHEMESQYVSIEYILSAPAYVQLSYAYYPYLRVLIDGQEVDSFPTSFGMIGVQSQAGKHTLEIVPYLSPLRVIVGGVNAASIVGLLAFWALSFKRRLSIR